MNRILKPFTYVLAAVYFLVDAVFMTVATPISNWIAARVELKRLRDWIRSLPPYASLALISVPLIILEPVKPLAAYLAATGKIMPSAIVLVVGELLKLVLVERLFSLTRDKLMTIPAFAWVYARFLEAKAWLETTEAWRIVHSVRMAVRDYTAHLKATLVRQS